jgi:ERCC4-related helicase
MKQYWSYLITYVTTVTTIGRIYVYIYFTVLAVLVGNNRLSHLISHSLYLFPTSPLVLHHCRARTLELANSRTVDSRTLDCRLSNSCIR